VRVGLTASLEVIDNRLEERSRQQVERGLVAETQAALRAGVPATAAVLTGIGYAEALAHIRGDITLEELPAAMAQSNRQYARRQLRWWRRDPRVRWFELEPAAPRAQGALSLMPAILKYLKERI
jgi:tRNA dimethylallyltransferase